MWSALELRGRVRRRIQTTTEDADRASLGRSSRFSVVQSVLPLIWLQSARRVARLFRGVINCTGVAMGRRRAAVHGWDPARQFRRRG